MKPHVSPAAVPCERARASDDRRRAAFGPRPGISIVELVAVMMMISVIAAIAMPRLDLRGTRIDAAARSLNMQMLAAHRTAIQQQHNVVISFDTVNALINIHSDEDNDGVVDPTEMLRQHKLGDGARFGLGGATARGIGSQAVTFKKTQNGLPALTFSRAGTASEIGGFYLSSPGTGAGGATADTRAFEVERATGRTERFLWDAYTMTWSRAF